jgi:mono/diheme cytochrome c family protein
MTTLRQLSVVMLTMVPVLGFAVDAASTQAKRGHYIVELAGCGHCHTPGHFRGKEDASRELGGGDVGFEVPGAGTFVGPNLTPDKQTGLGTWSDQQIATAIRSGVRPDGRMLSPVMPWPEFSNLNDADLKAIIVYLRTLKPVSNQVPGPLAAGKVPTLPAWRMFNPLAPRQQNSPKPTE